MLRTKSKDFNYSEELQQPASEVKNPKASRTKFIRDLYIKSTCKHNNALKNGNSFSNTLQSSTNILSSKSTSKSTVIKMTSLLQRAIPGARILKGQWKDNKLHGEVIINYDNGSKFQGKYENGVKVQGKMVYSQAKCEYEGGFFGELFSGLGKLTYQGGRSIEGEWNNMSFIGNATITYPNKDIYYGPVDQKLYKHGQGYLFLHNGYKYIGMFKHGSLSGVGSYYKEQKLIVKGVWSKGKLLKQLKNGDQSQFISSNFNSEVSLNFKEQKQNLAKSNDFQTCTKLKDNVEQYQTSLTSSILNLKSRERNLIQSFEIQLQTD